MVGAHKISVYITVLIILHTDGNINKTFIIITQGKKNSSYQHATIYNSYDKTFSKQQRRSL